MSARANASARARRAGITTPDPAAKPQPVAQGAPGQSASGLTLPQVIALVDTRLTTLETFMRETKEQGLPSGQTNFGAASVQFADQIPIQTTDETGGVDGDNENTTLEAVLEDFNGRFITIANEIAELKDMVLKLQSYTMDVNKSLLEDRIRVLSNLGEQGDGQVFTMSSFDTEAVDASAVDI